MEPKVTIPNEATAVENVSSEDNADLAYTLALEILPKIELADFKASSSSGRSRRSRTRKINEALDKIAEQNRPFAAKAEGAKAEKGDRVVIDFAGRIDGRRSKAALEAT